MICIAVLSVKYNTDKIVLNKPVCICSSQVTIIIFQDVLLDRVIVIYPFLPPADLIEKRSGNVLFLSFFRGNIPNFPKTLTMFFTPIHFSHGTLLSEIWKYVTVVYHSPSKGDFNGPGRREFLSGEVISYNTTMAVCRWVTPCIAIGKSYGKFLWQRSRVESLFQT